MIKAVKSVVKFSANIIAGIGLVILCFGLFVLYNKLGQFYQDLYYSSADWLETLQKYGFIILGSVVFLIGCTGVYGSTKNPKFQKSCLIIYEIGAITFLIVCSALAIFTLVYSNDIIGEGKQQYISQTFRMCRFCLFLRNRFSNQKSRLTLMFKPMLMLYRLFLQIYIISVIFLSKSITIKYITLDTLNLNQKVFAGKNYTTQEDLEVKIQKVQECPTYQIDQYAASAQMIQAAEQLLHCTGWCNPSIYYLFSDINDDSNNGKSCFMETKEFVESTGKIMGYVLLGLGILFGLNVFFVILLCCQKEKRNRIDYLMGEV